MAKKKIVEEQPPVVPAENKDKSLLSSQEVEEVVSGDEEALSEQMERIKNVSKEQQLEAIENEKRKKIEEEAKKREAELKAQQQAINDAKIREQKQKEAEALEKQRIEAEKLRKQQEIEAQKNAQAEALKAQQEQQRLEEEAKRREQQKLINEQAASSNVAQTNMHLQASKSVSSNEPKSDQAASNEGGPTTFKRVLAVLLFISLMAMIYFLPEITSYINELKEKNNQQDISDGTLICSLKKTSENLDINIEAMFYFSNKQMYKLSYNTVSTGDKVEDATELKALNDKCLLLKDEAGQLDGVTISCSLNNGVNSNKQILDYEKLDLNKVTSAYTEAGGIYPGEFKKSEDISKIESEMISNGYKCEKR